MISGSRKKYFKGGTLRENLLGGLQSGAFSETPCLLREGEKFADENFKLTLLHGLGFRMGDEVS